MDDDELESLDDSSLEHVRGGQVLRRKITKMTESYPKSAKEIWDILNNESPVSIETVHRHINTLLDEDKIKLYQNRDKESGRKYTKNYTPGGVEVMKVVHVVAVTGDSLQRCDEAAQWMRNEIC